MNFYKNYNRLVGITYIFLLLGAIGYFYIEIQDKRADELQLIRGRVARHAAAIELILRASTDYVDAMRINAWAFYNAMPPGTALESSLFKTLRHDSRDNYFHLDDALNPDYTGNLTGAGPIAGRSGEFHREIEMALDLAGTFQFINLSLPSFESAYYLSASGFQNLFPWEPSYKRRYHPSIRESVVFRMGLPANNPARAKYWTPAYINEDGDGLMISVAAPIYDGDVFQGVVAINLDLEYLNRVNADFPYDLGAVYVVNELDELLAHPSRIDAVADRAVVRLADGLPKDLVVPRKGGLDALPLREILSLGPYIVIQDEFRGAPWRLVYVLPEAELIRRLVVQHGPQAVLLVAALTILLVISNRITRREFVQPANQLVEHIDRESRFEAAAIPARVSPAWRPWFETISKAFRIHSEFLAMRQELDVARRMQLAILPSFFPDRADMALFGTMRSAKEVGGDFFDYFMLDGNRMGVVVADVSGKGVPAALFAMVSRTLLRALESDGRDVGRTMAQVNNMLCADNDSATFVTVFYGVLDLATGTLAYVNGGHPPPVHIRADGAAAALALTDGVALGLVEDMVFEQATLHMAPGDSLVLFTDGVSEAMDVALNEFTDARVREALAGSQGLAVRDLVKMLVEKVDRFAGEAPQADDITVVALTYRGATSVDT